MKVRRRIVSILAAAMMTTALLPALPAGVYAAQPDPDGMADAYELKLDDPISVTYNGGKTTYFHFQAPDTGYYSLTTWGKTGDAYNEGYLITLYDMNDWPVTAANPDRDMANVTSDFTWFMVKDGHYYIAAGASGEEESDGYSIQLTEDTGFDAFVNGCETWNIVTQPETSVYIEPQAEDDFGPRYKPFRFTVPADGYYRFTAKYTNVGGSIRPIILDETGATVCKGSLYDNPSVLGAYFETGQSYYILPSERTIYDGGYQIAMTAESYDPSTSEYCTDGLRHNYDDEIVKATFETAGSGIETCPVCGHVGEQWGIAAVGEPGLVHENGIFKYTGEEIKPEVSVNTNSLGDYDLEYSDNVQPGTGSVKITLKEWYEGTRTLYFKIVDPESSERTNVEEAAVSNITLPAPGKKPVNTGGKGITTPENAHYSVTDFEWVDCDDWNGFDDYAPLTENQTFKKGSTYYARIVLTAKAGFCFQTEDVEEDDILTPVVINGIGEDTLDGCVKMADSRYDDTTGDVKSIVIVSDFLCSGGDEPGPGEPDGKPISSAAVTVKLPKEGTKSSTAPTVTLPADAPYEVQYVDWFGPAPGYQPEPEEYVFEAGKTYRMYVTLKAKKGYFFRYTASAEVSGGTLIETDVSPYDLYDTEGYSGFVAVIQVRLPAEQSITVGAGTKITKTYGNAAFSLKAKTNGDGKLTYSSSDAGVATVSNKGKVTIKGAGTVTITVRAAATDAYKSASKKVRLTVNKAKNTLTASAAKKTNVVSYKALQKETQYISAKDAYVISGNKGKVTYKKTSGTGKITVNEKTGKITVKKGTKKDTYKIKVKVTAAGNGNYKPGSKTVTLNIKVK